MRAVGPESTASSTSTLTLATVSMRSDQQLVAALLNAPPLAISSDGTQIAYTVSEGTTLQLYVLRLDEFEPRQVPDSDGANSPFFSPDGQWIGFFARDGLYRASTTGGAPVRIADGPAIASGAQWTVDDTIYYSDLNRLHRVPASGGTTEVVFQAADSGLSFVFGPDVMPGGDRLLAQVAEPDLSRRVVAVDVDTGQITEIPDLEGASWAALRDETLYYLRGSDLWSGRFDLADLGLTDATVVLEDVEFQSNSRLPLAAMSASGTLVYAPRGPENQLVWVDRQGETEPLPVEPGRYRFPRLEPAGSRILVADNPREAESELRLIDLERGGTTRLAPGDFPVWSADGQSVTFASAEGVGLTLTQISIASPSNLTHLMTEGNNVAGDWTADGRLHVFYRIESDTNRDIWVWSDDGGSEPFLVTPANERTPYFEPSGRWIVYVSDVSGRDEVYVQAYPHDEERFAISTDGGREPVWSANGTEILYRSGQQMMVVEVAAGDTFDASAPRVLFEGRFGYETTGLVNYDVTTDGQRFLMITDGSPTELRVIENFGAMVEERLAGGR
jgi:serine/threonine-protein kinase